MILCYSYISKILVFCRLPQVNRFLLHRKELFGVQQFAISLLFPTLYCMDRRL